MKTTEKMKKATRTIAKIQTVNSHMAAETDYVTTVGIYKWSRSVAGWE